MDIPRDTDVVCVDYNFKLFFPLSDVSQLDFLVLSTSSRARFRNHLLMCFDKYQEPMAMRMIYATVGSRERGRILNINGSRITWT